MTSLKSELEVMPLDKFIDQCKTQSVSVAQASMDHFVAEEPKDAMRCAERSGYIRGVAEAAKFFAEFNSFLFFAEDLHHLLQQPETPLSRFTN